MSFFKGKHFSQWPDFFSLFSGEWIVINWINDDHFARSLHIHLVYFGIKYLRMIFFMYSDNLIKYCKLLYIQALLSWMVSIQRRVLLEPLGSSPRGLNPYDFCRGLWSQSSSNWNENGRSKEFFHMLWGRFLVSLTLAYHQQKDMNLSYAKLSI